MEKEIIRPRHIHLSSIEEFEEFFTGLDHRYIQLSPGALNLSSTFVELQGVQLHWNLIEAKFFVTEIHQDSKLWFGFHLDGSASPIHLGKELEFGTALVWHAGREREYLIPKSTTSLVIRVDAWLMEKLGWSVNDRSLQSVPPCQLRRLADLCRIASDARIQVDPILMRDQILDALELALAPWLEPSLPLAGAGFQGSRYHRVFKEASGLIESGRPEDIGKLADSLGVTKRTLYRAFRQWLGMGPYSYMQATRLYEFRNLLLQASPDNSSVTRLAYDCGFTEMGRLSATYREYFGELPSNTLRRD